MTKILDWRAFVARKGPPTPLIWCPRDDEDLIENPVGGEVMWIKHARNQEPRP